MVQAAGRMGRILPAYPQFSSSLLLLKSPAMQASSLSVGKTFLKNEAIYLGDKILQLVLYLRCVLTISQGKWKCQQKQQKLIGVLTLGEKRTKAPHVMVLM